MASGFATLSVSAQSWGGVYSYHANLGRTAGGTRMNIDYEIAIEDDLNGMAEISANGYMTYNTVLCSTRKKGASLELRFLSYPDGKMKNEFGVQLYKKGDVLMTLTRITKAGKTNYRVVMGKYNSELKGPVYFKKTK